MIFLDSDAVIAFLREEPAMAAFLASHKQETFAIPVPVLFEMYYGFFYPPLSKRFKKDAHFLARLQEESARLNQLLLDIQVFDLTPEAVKIAADVAATLDALGKPVGKMDILIAGIVLSVGETQLATNNTRHYENIPKIAVLNF